VFNETLAKRINDTKAICQEEYSKLENEYEEYKKTANKEINRLKLIVNSIDQEVYNSQYETEIIKLENEIIALSEEYDNLSLKIKSRTTNPNDKYSIKQRMYQIADLIQENSENLIALKKH